MYVYIYIYIHTCNALYADSIYIYTYIHMFPPTIYINHYLRSRDRQHGAEVLSQVALRAKGHVLRPIFKLKIYNSGV